MSGPKYSDFVLERRRLLMIKAQLEAELERVKCDRIINDINDCIEKSNQYFARIEFETYEKNIITAEEITETCTSHELKSLITELKNTIAEKYRLKGNSDELTNILSLYKKRLTRAKNLVYQIEDLMRKLNAEYNQKKQELREVEFENTKWDSPEKVSSVSEKLMKVYSGIIKQLIDCDDFESEKAKYDKILNNHSFDDGYKESQMKMNFESYLVEKQSDNDNNEILKLRSEYIALSVLIYGECLEVPNDIDCLKEEIAAMAVEAQERKVGQYVATCIDRVMSDMGYGIAGNEVLTAQKITKQHYDYSDDSAITIASSDNGAMMLEVVGKKKKDGTNGSAASVKSDMERFCPDYQKIKEGLKQYGIILNDKKLFPPDEKYVRFVDIEKPTAADRRITAKNRKKRMNYE